MPSSTGSSSQDEWLHVKMACVIVGEVDKGGER